MPFKAMLSNLSPFRKLLFAIGIMFFSCFIFMMVSFVIIKFYYGINLFSNSDILNDFTNPDVIKSMKFLQVLSGELGLFIIPVFASAFFFDNSPLGYLQLKKRTALISFFLVAITLIASMPFINWMIEINSCLKLPDSLSSLEQWMKRSEEEATRLTEAFLAGTSINSLLTNIFIVALLPAFGEELFFRGIMQKLFSQMTKNNNVAIFITAIIFSAIHMQFFGFLPRMVLGIFLGYLLVWSGSLWLPILAHFINNAAAVLFTFLQKQNKINFDPDTVGTNADEKIILLCSIIITFFLIYLIYKIESNEKRHQKIICR